MSNFNIELINEKENNIQIIKCKETEFILDCAEKNNIELPYSCRAGSCSTCLAKMIKGNVKQSDQTFLDNDQIKNGYVLLCVSIPTSDAIILTHQEDNLY